MPPSIPRSQGGGPGGPPPLPLPEALERVRAAAPAPTRERVPLAEALGRVLAEELASLADHPSTDNSGLDGYACREEDTRGATEREPRRLRVIGEAPAGGAFRGSVAAGEAVRIYTGGPVPDGADAIVPVEATEEEHGRVALRQPARSADVRRRAEDLTAGTTYLRAGRRLDAAAVALAAAMGHPTVLVARRPRVAVLSTGDEVIAPGEPLRAGQVYDSNAAALHALTTAAGAEPVPLPHVPDDVAGLRAALDEAGPVDLLLTSGGVSMGRYDVVRDLLFEHGEVLFWKVAIKPGGPVLFGRYGGVHVLGLPGNPVSSMVIFLLLGRAYLDACTGRTGGDLLAHARWVRAGTAFRGAGVKEAFHRGVLRGGRGGDEVHGVASQSSGVLRSMTEADALVRVPAGIDIEAGDLVEAIALAPWLG